MDASIHLAGVVRSDARATIEMAGSKTYLDGNGPPLIALRLSIDGESRQIGADGMVWERELSWLPTFSCVVGDIALRGTIFAPYGVDADLAGAVIAVSAENRGQVAANVSLGVAGKLGHRQQRIRSARPLDDQHSVRAAEGAIVMEGTGAPAYCALVVAADGADAQAQVNESELTWTITRDLTLAPGATSEHAFLITAGSEPDGALATLSVMRRRGWRQLLASTRAALQKIEQSTSERGVDRLINRNLMFACFTGIARAIDDGRIYLARSRMPWNGRGLTITDWDALMWLLPAVQLADSAVARDTLTWVCALLSVTMGVALRATRSV
jgi:hypothetical protein